MQSICRSHPNPSQKFLWWPSALPCRGYDKSFELNFFSFMSTNDPDLEGLVADMSVAQTLGPRRMGGLV
jgi:hypothetical protein